MTRFDAVALTSCILEMHQDVCDEGGQNFPQSEACKTALKIVEELKMQGCSRMPRLREAGRAWTPTARDAVWP